MTAALGLHNLRAIGIPGDKFCRACFDGDYPIKIPHVRVSKFALEMPINAK